MFIFISLEHYDNLVTSTTPYYVPQTYHSEIHKMHLVKSNTKSSQIEHRTWKVHAGAFFFKKKKNQKIFRTIFFLVNDWHRRESQLFSRYSQSEYNVRKAQNHFCGFQIPQSANQNWPNDHQTTEHVMRSLLTRGLLHSQPILTVSLILQ